jgi:protein SCO1/2
MAAPAAALGSLIAVQAATGVAPSAAMGSMNIPNVKVTTHEGKTFRFYDDLVKGKTVLINFFYADCVGICPRMTSNLLKIQKALGDSAGKDTFIYSISLKPEKDSPKHLAEYASMHGIKANSGWYLLNAKRADMELLRARLGFRDTDPLLDKDLNQHTGLLRFGNDNWNTWAACPLLGDPDSIVETLKFMDLGRQQRRGLE